MRYRLSCCCLVCPQLSRLLVVSCTFSFHCFFSACDRKHAKYSTRHAHGLRRRRTHRHNPRQPQATGTLFAIARIKFIVKRKWPTLHSCVTMGLLRTIDCASINRAKKNCPKDKQEACQHIFFVLTGSR